MNLKHCRLWAAVFLHILCRIRNTEPMEVIDLKKDDDRRILLPPIFPGMSGLAPMPMPIFTDPNGSYTGRPSDPEDRPVQDADDL